MANDTQSLQKIYSIIQDLALRNKMVSDCQFGPTWNIGTIPILTPYIWVEPTTTRVIRSTTGMGTQLFGFNIYCMDRINKGDDNWLETQSDTRYILETMIAQIDNHPYFIQNNISFIDDQILEPQVEFSDINCNGWVWRCNFNMPVRYGLCNTPYYPVTGFTVSLNSNIAEYRLIGATGPQGPIGPTGPQGATGIGVTGPAGATGAGSNITLQESIINSALLTQNNNINGGSFSFNWLNTSGYVISSNFYIDLFAQTELSLNAPILNLNSGPIVINGSAGASGSILTSNGPTSSPTWNVNALTTFQQSLINGSVLTQDNEVLGAGFDFNFDTDYFQINTTVLGQGFTVNALGTQMNVNANQDINFFSMEGMSLEDNDGSLMFFGGSSSYLLSSAFAMDLVSSDYINITLPHSLEINSNPGLTGYSLISQGPGLPPIWSHIDTSGTQSWQDTLLISSILLQDNVVDGGGFNLSFNDNETFSIGIDGQFRIFNPSDATNLLTLDDIGNLQLSVINNSIFESFSVNQNGSFQFIINDGTTGINGLSLSDSGTFNISSLINGNGNETLNINQNGIFQLQGDHGNGDGTGFGNTLYVDRNGVVTFNNIYSFPNIDGLIGQALITNGSGLISWGTMSVPIFGIDDVLGVNQVLTTNRTIDIDEHTLNIISTLYRDGYFSISDGVAYIGDFNDDFNGNFIEVNDTSSSIILQGDNLNLNIGRFFIDGDEGSSGQVFTSNGSGEHPTWQDATGGATPSWQDTLLVSSTLTQSNIIDGGAFNLTFDNNDVFQVNVLDHFAIGDSNDSNSPLLNITNRDFSIYSFNETGGSLQTLDLQGDGALIISGNNNEFFSTTTLSLGNDGHFIIQGNDGSENSATTLQLDAQGNLLISGTIDSVNWNNNLSLSNEGYFEIFSNRDGNHNETFEVFTDGSINVWGIINDIQNNTLALDRWGNFEINGDGGNNDGTGYGEVFSVDANGDMEVASNIAGVVNQTFGINSDGSLNLYSIVDGDQSQTFAIDSQGRLDLFGDGGSNDGTGYDQTFEVDRNGQLTLISVIAGASSVNNQTFQIDQQGDLSLRGDGGTGNYNTTFEVDNEGNLNLLSNIGGESITTFQIDSSGNLFLNGNGGGNTLTIDSDGSFILSSILEDITNNTLQISRFGELTLFGDGGFGDGTGFVTTFYVDNFGALTLTRNNGDSNFTTLNIDVNGQTTLRTWNGSSFVDTLSITTLDTTINSNRNIIMNGATFSFNQTGGGLVFNSTAGSSGQVLTSQGSGTTPIWSNVVSASGTFSQSEVAVTTVTVTIGSTQPNNTYRISLTPTSLLASTAWYINNQTTTTFDVVYTTAITGVLTFYWSLFK